MLATRDSRESRRAREHLVELALLTGKVARRIRQPFPMPRDRFRKAPRFIKRCPRRLVELFNLTGEMRDDRAEIIHTVAERMLRRREIRS